MRSIYHFLFYFFLIMNSYSIHIDNDNGKIIIIFNNPINKILTNSFYYNILNAPCFNSLFTHLSFYASSCESLSTYLKHNGNLTYNQTINLLYCLNKQQQLLEKNNTIFHTFNPNDIIIIDKLFFVCISSLHLKNIKGNQILLNSPFEIIFGSPELLTIHKLPAKCHKNSAIFSLAQLAFFSLFKNIYSSSSSYSHLDTIKYTKLYWFFKKGLEQDYNKRLYYNII